MFKTADGETLELAPWRLRRLLRLIADARHYPAGTPPHTLITDLRQIIARARRTGGNPRIGTAHYQSKGACCQACLMAQQRRDVLELVGLSIASSPMAFDTGLNEFETELLEEFETAPRSATLTLDWACYNSLEKTLEALTAQSKNAGIYIIRRGIQPLYVGKSSDLKERVGFHLSNARRYKDTSLKACISFISNPYHQAAVEHALVRALQRYEPSNVLLNAPLTVGKKPLDIRNLLPFKTWQTAELKAKKNRLYRAPGSEYEFWQG
ncbi:GIY-YIG nuclease family protein [Silvimonas amylolytica]|uniref:GIY-YIG domain-containing protein n=1 Tax=Silvimonas amylolytica TaxID=449663 RepID=A0ABQ2PNS1_9NEIS|nr:GIY-YIG nuclease family protein [Silvimonas amylolytica]GGP26971.1 hypothetical protein GCM10010971_27900 [Silvimonas amylolytica]